MALSCVVVDLETSGLDPNTGEIFEIALIGLDEDWAPQFEWNGVMSRAHVHPSVVIDDVVREMHEKSGLFDAMIRSGNTAANLREHALLAVSQMFKATQTEKGSTYLAGSGVGHFDKPWLSVHMPELVSWFKYRVLDVSVIRECLTLVHGKGAPGIVYSGGPTERVHRALEDARDHARELRYYMTEVLPRLAPAAG